MTPAINLPGVLAEVQAAFDRYEQALVSNDLDALDAHFWHADAVVRYGVGENLVGIEAIRAFRRSRPSTGLARALRHTVITTYGQDFATAMTEFHRESDPRIGRQSQTWVRFTQGGWKIVAAHVSLLAP